MVHPYQLARLSFVGILPRGQQVGLIGRYINETQETAEVVGCAAVDTVGVSVLIAYVCVLYMQAVGVDEKPVDILLRAAIQPGAVVEAGKKGLGDRGVETP